MRPPGARAHARRPAPGATIIVKELAVQGNRRVQEAVILGRVSAKVGGPFVPARLADDIRAVFSLGFFDDVQAKVEDFEGGVKLTFVVTERPFVRDINFVGNKRLDCRNPPGEDRLQARRRVQPGRGDAGRRKAEGSLRGGGVLRGRRDAGRRQAARRRRQRDVPGRRGPKDDHRQDRHRGRAGPEAGQDQGDHADPGAGILHPAGHGPAAEARPGHRARRHVLQRQRLRPGAGGVGRHAGGSRDRARHDPDRGGRRAAVQGRRHRHHRQQGAARRGAAPAHPAQAR